MEKKNTAAENTCVIPTFERNRYFAGKPMMVGDFEAEQQYLIGKNRLQNRLIHGAGIICGLRLNDASIKDGQLAVEISEGAALDCCGNLIAVNQPTRVEVQQKDSIGESAGKFYLYIRFSECIRQPIMATTNASSCEEVCCYNRIRETFEIILSDRGPSSPRFSFTGFVNTSDSGGGPIVGAKIRALQEQVVKAETLTDNDGAFSLGVSVDNSSFDIEASATGFSTAVRSESIPAGQQWLNEVNFQLAASTGEETVPAEVCNELVQKYFEGHSLTCLGCDDPKVFLGIVDVGGTVSVEQNSPETRQNRAVVYTNPMLHDLFCDHVSDFNNPHRTTARQVRALKTVNFVGNLPGAQYVGNIDLVSIPKTIEVTSNASQREIDLQLAADAVKPEHLNPDTINGLITSDETISIVRNLETKNILIRTNPATRVTSIGPVQNIGASPNFARQDHAHDLADGVVTRPKLGEDVIKTLLTSDGTITITDLAAKQISIRTNPAVTVTSVGKEKDPGTSNRFSPEDHQHNFLINERGPDKDGLFLLTAGRNVEIGPGKADNELVLSATTPEPFHVTTGIVRFERVGLRESRTSPDVKTGLKSTNVALVLALLQKEFLLIGDLGRSMEQPPVISAQQRVNTDTFQIGISDTRKQGNLTTYIVRWWAIPFTEEMEPVVSQPPLSPPPA
jgi:Carboxypeptidase regulatory-like domain